MASKLDGLFRTLKWSDFTTVTKPVPKPGDLAPGAFTDANIKLGSPKPNVAQVPGSRPAVWKLEDAVTVLIEFNGSSSWVADWVFTLSQDKQDKLLKHEQGHYDMNALMGRDMFIALMDLKPTDFKTRNEGVQAVNKIINANNTMVVKVRDAYENATKNGHDDTAQADWNGFFQTAFTTPRSPVRMTPDNKKVKITLLDVLKRQSVKL